MNVDEFSSERLYFGSIKLVPVAAPYFPYNLDRYKDHWHIPGRTIMSTDALVTLANKRGVAVSIVEQRGPSTETTRLN